MRRMNAAARNPAAEPRGSRKAIVRRRPAPPRWRRAALRFGLAGVMLLAVTAGAFWIRHSAIPSLVQQRVGKAVADLGTAAGFRLQRITVDGRVFTPREDLLTALDLRLGEPMLEINTQPGMTPLSLVPEQAAYRGISFPDLVAWMVEHARCDA